MKSEDTKKMLEDLFLKECRLTVRISGELHEDIKKLAKHYKMPVSKLLRYLLITGVNYAKKDGKL